jgi:hypothetical protein
MNAVIPHFLTKIAEGKFLLIGNADISHLLIRNAEFALFNKE